MLKYYNVTIRKTYIMKVEAENVRDAQAQARRAMEESKDFTRLSYVKSGGKGVITNVESSGKY